MARYHLRALVSSKLVPDDMAVSTRSRTSTCARAYAEVCCGGTSSSIAHGVRRQSRTVTESIASHP